MTRSTLFSRNHPTLLLIKKRRSTDATGGLLSKNFAIFTGKHICWSLFFNFIEKRLQHRCFPVNIGKFVKNLFWRTSPYACFWRDFRKWLIRTFILKRRFQNHPDFVILQKYQSLSNLLELFSATCCLCILQTQLTRRNASIPKKFQKCQKWLSWWRHQMMTKVTFVSFLSSLIPYCQYSMCTKFHVK